MYGALGRADTLLFLFKNMFFFIDVYSVLSEMYLKETWENLGPRQFPKCL